MIAHDDLTDVAKSVREGMAAYVDQELFVPFFGPDVWDGTGEPHPFARALYWHPFYTDLKFVAKIVPFIAEAYDSELPRGESCGLDSL